MNSNPAATGYYVQLRTTDGQVVAGSGWVTGTQFRFDNLVLGRTYEAYVKARNSDGIETVWVKIGSATTVVGSVNPPTPGQVTVTAGAYTGTWGPNGNPPGTEYYAELLDASGRILTSSGWTPDSGYTFTGLTPNTQYRVRVKARYGTLESDWAYLTQKYTLANQPVSQTVKWDTGLYVQWTANGNPFGTGFLIEVTDAAGNSLAKYGWTIGASYRFTSLPQVSEYQVWGKARNKGGVETDPVLLGAYTPGSGSGGAGGGGTVKQPAADAVSVTETSYTAAWKPNGNPSGAEYYVELRDVAGQVLASSGWIPGTAYTFTGLNPNTRYKAYVKARYSGVESAWTGLAQKFTLARVPEGVSILTGGVVPLSWTPLDYDFQATASSFSWFCHAFSNSTGLRYPSVECRRCRL